MRTDHLVIGGDGFIGSAVCAELERRQCEFIETTRRDSQALGAQFFFRLGIDDPHELPAAEAVYLIAAMPKFQDCEGNPTAWLVNVDAQIAIARTARAKSGAFIVFISSDCVEWCGSTAMARQKAQVESFIQTIDGAIIRPTRVAPALVGDLAREIVRVGLDRKPGLVRWGHERTLTTVKA